MEFLRIVFVVISLLSHGYTGTIRCYHCRGYAYESCAGSTLESAEKEECSSLCMKTSSYSNYTIFNIRNCGPDLSNGITEGCTSESGVVTCYCSKDLCNSAHVPHIFVSMATAVILINVLHWC